MSVFSASVLSDGSCKVAGLNKDLIKVVVVIYATICDKNVDAKIAEYRRIISAKMSTEYAFLVSRNSLLQLEYGSSKMLYLHFYFFATQILG